MKLKLSKDKEKVLYIVSSCITGIFAVSFDIDWFQKVSIMAYISSSIMALIAIVMMISRDIYKANKYQKYSILGLFLLVLIIQIIVGKAMFFGIIINLLCYISELSRIGILEWKEKEEEKERKRLE